MTTDVAAKAWETCFNQLKSIRALQDDWDGAGSEPISGEIVDSVHNILSQLSKKHFDDPPDRIIASPSGSIIIEWHDRNSYIGAEIEEPYVVEWMARNAYGTIHKTTTYSRRLNDRTNS